LLAFFAAWIENTSVTDQHWFFFADPDPAFYLNADPDPGIKTNADPYPDPGQTLQSQKVLFYLFIC
jgi:hypothetical protein